LKGVEKLDIGQSEEVGRRELEEAIYMLKDRQR
jgi:hypothetical protein